MLPVKTTYRLCAIGIAILMLNSVQTKAQNESDYQDTGDPVKNVYVNLVGQMAIPEGSFRQFSKNRGGFRLEGGINFSQHSPFSIGGDLGILFSSSKKDQFKGLEVETSSTLIDLQPFLRWSPRKYAAVRPYLNVSAGLTLAGTQTTSEIIDRPTFLEEFLLGAEEEVITTTHKELNSTNFSYGAGAGLYISRHIILGIRYQKVKPVEYVDKSEVFVKNGELMYEAHRIPLDMWVLTFGISF